ncbi:hypothetical protein M0802_009716 [Mischocyttarus mexicanus]|nr:hypothetical protein M0802_009716 [Mischocyttarus mexicanus]
MKNGTQPHTKAALMIKWTYKVIQLENKMKREETARKMAAIEKVVRPGISYANMTAKANFGTPILQNPLPVGLSDLGTTKPKYPPRDGNTDNESGNLNSLEHILINFKNDIIREMQKIKIKMKNNSIRIDKIMSHLNLD